MRIRKYCLLTEKCVGFIMNMAISPQEKDMRKILLIMILIFGLMLTGCGSAETEVVIVPVEGGEPVPLETPAPEGGEEQEAEIIEGESEEPAKPEAEAFMTIDPKAVWEMYGYTHFKAEKGGIYNFELLNSEGIDWEVYVLDEEFPDAERYIPQVYEPVVVGQGAANIEEGKIIYLYSSANSWTMIETPEGCICRITFIK